MPRPRLLIPLALSLFALAILAGCGDEDESTAGNGSANATSTSGGDSSEAQFAEEANEICEKHAKVITKRSKEVAIELVPDSGSPTSDSATITELSSALLQKAVAPELEAEIEEIEALEVPAGDEAQIDQMVTLMQKAIAEGRKNPAAFGRQVQPFQAAEEAAEDYGISSCGGPG